MYYALERLMQRVAVELKLDPIDVIRRNLVPSNAFPYRTASGALLDSGDYANALDIALARRRIRRTGEAPRRRRARKAASTASAARPWSSRASPTWATSPPC